MVSPNTSQMDGKTMLGDVVDKYQILDMEYLRIAEVMEVIRGKGEDTKAADMDMMEGNLITKIMVITIQPTIKDMATANLTHTTTINTTTDAMEVIVCWTRNQWRRKLSKMKRKLELCLNLLLLLQQRRISHQNSEFLSLCLSPVLPLLLRTSLRLFTFIFVVCMCLDLVSSLG